MEATENHAKKKTTQYQEQNPEQVAAYQEEVKEVSLKKIAYVDECGIDTYLDRTHGYAPKNQRVFDRIRGHKYERCGIVAAQMDGKILAPFQYSKTMDANQELNRG